MRGEPCVGRRLVAPTRGPRRRAGEDAVEVREWTGVTALAAPGRATPDGDRPPAAAGPEEDPVAAPEGSGARHPLGDFVDAAQVPGLAERHGAGRFGRASAIA